MTDYVEKQLGNYRIERLLAQGGFGDVYLGEHIHLGTQAAIKVLSTQIIREDIEQFRTEARTIARLIHPNIIRILEFGVEGTTPFLVMDYATHGTLRQRHPKGSQVPLTTIVSYVKQIAGALQYAHDNKLIHRDVKPENMLIGRHNELLLSDFGIALIAQSSRYEGAQDMAGTIAYMAPEQIQAHPRPASDQYALSVIIYEWLSGDKPFHGSFTEIAAKHTAISPPSLREKIPTLSPDVEHVVMTALAKDPQQRFASMQAFALALEQASQDGLETVFSVKPNIRSSQQEPMKETLFEEAEPVILASEDARESSKGDELREKQVTPNDHNKIVWTITFDRTRIMSLFLPTIIGIILYSIVTILLDPTTFIRFGFPFSHSVYAPSIPSYSTFVDAFGGLVMFDLFEVIPLFFGARFGSFTGLLTGGLGFFIGTYFSEAFKGQSNGSLGEYFNFYSSNGLWGVLLSVMLIGFTAGLAAVRTQKRYRTLRNLALASIFGYVGVIAGTSLLLVTLYAQFYFYSAAAWLALPFFIFALPSLVLLPILLSAYDAGIEYVQRVRSGRLRADER